MKYREKVAAEENDPGIAEGESETILFKDSKGILILLFLIKISFN